MIVLANEDFATGLRLAGIKQSIGIHSKEQLDTVLKDISKEEFIIATEKVISLIDDVEEYPNLVSFPDTLHDFSKIDDLKEITQTAIGSEVEL